MKHLYKNFDLKADDTGTISGYFSTYDRIPDSYGDIVAPGAFTDTIKARKDSGHPFPLCWNHDLDQIIGYIDPEDIKETEKGPFMEKAVFFNTALAQEKRELVLSGVVYQFSFAYDIEEARWTHLQDEDETEVYELQKLNLYEVSIVPIPANPRAEVTDIKATVEEYVKAGRRNSAKDAEAIKQAIALLQGVLDDTEDEPDGEDGAKANGAPEEPEKSNPKKDELLEVIEKITKEK